MSITAGKPHKELSPGEMLEHFLEDMNITQYRLAKQTDVSHATISRIINGEARITANIALRFSIFFENSPQFWLNCQNHFDLYNLEKLEGKKIHKNVKSFSSLNLATA